jgi:lipopolysaccharide/colanic/teichoic acid biosynthesis glycosyltransferase
VSEHVQIGRAARVRGSTLAVDAMKRGLDIVLATIAIIVLLPLWLAAAIAIGVSSRGPVFFVQERLGRGQHAFVMLKFRTMYDGSGDAIHREFVTDVLTNGRIEDAPLQKLANDPRVTPVGRVLRRTSLDELPQLLNVLAGHMSLVGPRPALPWEAALFPPRHLVRFDVKPGITGLWQVSGRSELTMLQALDLDAEYVARRSTRLDLSILVRTIPIVVTGRGAS